MINAADILNGNILIVDDQPANIELLTKTLRAAGYTSISSTSNPLEVRGLHLEYHYDLILLDLQMPGMNGFQVIEALKEVETGGYLPVLVITAQPAHKLRALQSGARDFVGKPFELAELLARVHNLLEVRLLHRETQSLYQRVLEEQKVSERLLLNVLPASIVARLESRPEITAEGFKSFIADSFKDVTVLFADIVDFSKFAEGVSVEVLVGVLNDVFSRFDEIADRHGLERIKTSGDAYMVAAGLPVPVADHTQRAARMALDMMAAMRTFNEQSRYELKVRIGIATGAAVAGVVGRRKFSYDLWGEVVNQAGRMESHGVAGKIQISDSTRQRLGAPFTFERRGMIDVQGKGQMLTWFLTGHGGRPVAETQ